METAPQRKTKSLTKQDKAFVEKVVETGNLTRSVQDSYNIDNARYAAVKGQRLITKDNIIEAIEVKRKSLKEALLQRGINEDYLAEKVDVLLTAVDKEGNTDYAAVDKGLKHATNIYGIIEPEGKSGNTYNFILNPEVQSEVKKIEAILKAKLIQNHVSEN